MKKMPKNIKTALTVFSVFGSIFFVAYAVLLVVLTFLTNKSDFGPTLLLHLRGITNSFVLLFEGNGAVGAPMLYKILTVSVAGVSTLLLVIGFFVIVGKKYGKGIAFIIPLALFTFPALEVIANLPKYEDAFINTWKPGYLALVGDFSQLNYFALSLGIVVSAGLTYGCLLLMWLIGTAGAIKAKRVELPVEEPVEEEEFLPEPEPEELLPVAEPVEEPVIISEPVEEPEPLPEPEPEPQPEPEPEPEPEPQGLTLTKEDIAELIRAVVREEINKLPKEEKGPTQNAPIFNGPLVVQYFGVDPTRPQPAPEATPAPVVEQHVEEPQPAPVVEEPAPVVEETQPEPVVVEEPAPVVEEPAPVVEAPAPKAPIIRIPFEERILDADKELQETYNELKNYILSYGVKSRLSNSGDTFRLHRKTYVKITVAGKSLKLYLALNPDDYKDSTIPVQDAGHKDTYADIPLVFKVKSPLSVRRAKDLISAAMETDGLEQGNIETINYIKEIKANLKK